MNKKKEILAELKNGNDFLLISHISPDGDCLGSQIGLALALQKMEKRVAMVNADFVPETYKFLPSSAKIMAVEEVNFHFSTAIVLDCSDLKRLGSAAQLLDKCAKVINIDHHITNEYFGHYNYVEKEAAATGEIVYQLLEDLSLAIDEDIANALYTALVSDTGGFRHSNTSAACLEKAACLTKKGANPHWIAENIYQNFSLNSLKLLGEVFSQIKLSEDGKIAWVTVLLETLQKTGCTSEQTEGIIAYLLGITGVEVALLLKETGEKKIKVSLRARNKVDVSKIAAAFGGGGHIKAAGCLVEETVVKVEEMLLEATKKALEG